MENNEEAGREIVLLSSRPEFTAVNPVNSGLTSQAAPLFTREQVYWLSQLAAKLYLALVRPHRHELVSKYEDLGERIGVCRTSAYKAVCELRDNALVEVVCEVRKRGHVDGIRLRVLPPPPFLPESAYHAKREQLGRRRQKLVEELSEVDGLLVRLETDYDLRRSLVGQRAASAAAGGE